MNKGTFTILEDPAVAQRVSPATRAVLQARAEPMPHPRFLDDANYETLQAVVRAVLPQDAIGTEVDLADAIDQRLADGTNAGWRFADLPPDGEAYRQGLRIFAKMLEQTPMKTFDSMSTPAREGYLRCVANGDVDAPAQFPLSRWLGMLRTDVVRLWMASPAAMQKIGFYGFADGRTGMTNGPSLTEGWSALTPNKALPFEQGLSTPVRSGSEV